MKCQASNARLGAIRAASGLSTLALLLLAIPVEAADWKVTIRGQHTDLGETPIVAELAPSIPEGAYRLEPRGDYPAISAQVVMTRGKAYLVTVINSLPASAERSYSAARDSQADPAASSRRVPEGRAERRGSSGRKPVHHLPLR